jgi:hypothetical protein
MTYVIRLIAAILTSQIGVVCVPVRVAILQPAQSLIQCASAKVKSKVGFGTNDLAPLQKLIGTKLVALLTKPSKFWSRQTLAWINFSYIQTYTYLTGL